MWDQRQYRDSALPIQGHAPGREDTLSSLSNLDVQSYKCSQKEPNKATCLAEENSKGN